VTQNHTQVPLVTEHHTQVLPERPSRLPNSLSVVSVVLFDGFGLQFVLTGLGLAFSTIFHRVTDVPPAAACAGHGSKDPVVPGQDMGLS